MQNALPTDLKNDLDALIDQSRDAVRRRGVGVGRLSFDIKAEALGIDISREIEDELEDDSATEFLLAVGGGVNIEATSAIGFDVGYRFFRIFTDDPAINTSQVYGAVVFGF